MSYGFVYVASNLAMPGLLKIGMTAGSPAERLAQLSYSTGVPFRFDLEYAIECEDAQRIEALAHEQFKDMRANGSREFFYLNPSDVIEFLSPMAFNEIRPGTHFFHEKKIADLEWALSYALDILKEYGVDLGDRK